MIHQDLDGFSAISVAEGLGGLGHFDLTFGVAGVTQTPAQFFDSDRPRAHEKE
jgi:hypothetical protein